MNDTDTKLLRTAYTERWLTVNREDKNITLHLNTVGTMISADVTRALQKNCKTFCEEHRSISYQYKNLAFRHMLRAMGLEPELNTQVTDDLDLIRQAHTENKLSFEPNQLDIRVKDLTPSQFNMMSKVVARYNGAYIPGTGFTFHSKKNYSEFRMWFEIWIVKEPKAHVVKRLAREGGIGIEDFRLIKTNEDTKMSIEIKDVTLINGTDASTVSLNALLECIATENEAIVQVNGLPDTSKAKKKIAKEASANIKKLHMLIDKYHG